LVQRKIDHLELSWHDDDQVSRFVACRQPTYTQPTTLVHDWTTSTFDNNGNLVGTRTPIGTVGISTSNPVCPQLHSPQNDTCRTYDSNDNLLSTLTPMEANMSSQKFTTYTYDAFNNRLSGTDPNGNVTAIVYDNLNRPTMQYWTMAVWGAMPNPTGCEQSTSLTVPYSWFPLGDIMCFSTTAYDGVDNAVSSTDGSRFTSYQLFDAAHRVIVSTSPRNDVIFTNLVTVRVYNQDGQVTDLCPPRELSEGSADGFACGSTALFGTHTTYNAEGWVTFTTTYHPVAPTVTAEHANVVAYTYDADGNKATVTNANLFMTTYSYSVLDRMTSMLVPRVGSTAYPTTYTYDASGDQLEEDQQIDATKLIRTEYTYDADHRVVYTIHGASVAASGAPYSQANGTDVRTMNVYDPNGNIVEQFQPNAYTQLSGVGSVGNPDPDYQTAADYNADNEQIAVYQPRFDTATHAPALTDLTANATQSGECPAGAVSRFGFPSTLGVCTTKYSYDPDGNVSTVTWPTNDTNAVTTYAYTNTNQVLTETDPNPNASVGGTVASETYAYDAEGKRTDQTDANGIYTATAYTQDELPVTTTQTPNGTANVSHATSFLYDANGEEVQSTDAIGASSVTAYYPDGLTESVTDAVGDETSYVYDAVGNPVWVYSPDANAKAAANPSGTPTYNVYTEDNLLEATLIPVSATQTQRGVCYGYDRAGRKLWQGNVMITGAAIMTEPTVCAPGPPMSSFNFTLLPDSRLQQELGRNGATALSYTYDAVGNQLTSTDGTDTVTTTDTYYADDSLRTAKDGTLSDPRTTEYAYDGAGNVTARVSVPATGSTYTDTITYNDADLQATESNSISTDTVTWSYDAGGRLTQVSNALGIMYYGYAADGTLNDQQLLDDAGNILESDFSQTLDGDYRVTSDGCTTCENAAGTGVVGHTFTYQYDAAGRLIFINASGGSAAFQTYDQDGNRITHDDVVSGAYTNYTYNADNSIASTILSGTAVSATYDPKGAGVMISDGCESWTLDTFDRAMTLARATSPPSVCPATGPLTTTYQYDANGTMLTEAASGTTTTIHNDPTTSTPIVENVGSTTTTAYVLDSNGTPMEAGQGSTQLYLWDDPKGDLSTVMGGLTFLPTCQLQYDPYGTVVFGLSPSNQCETGSTFADLLYQNSRRDSSSGTYQLGSRTYDPSKNSFLSPDHFQMGTSGQDLSVQVDPLTENAYTYVDGDPVNRFDPTGHMFTTGTEGTGGDQTCTVCHTYATAETGKTRAQVNTIRTAAVRHDDAAHAVYKAAEQRKTDAAAATAASAARPGFQDGPQLTHYVPGGGACEYFGDGQVVCPDYAGNYGLTSDQYYQEGGYAPGDSRPQGFTMGDAFLVGSTVFALANLWDGEGEAQLAAEFAWESANASVDSGAVAVADDVPTLTIDAGRMPNIAQNIQTAQDSGLPSILNRETDQAIIDANRSAATKGFGGVGSPDEYPFASTMQGGAGAQVQGVPLLEQKIQGGVLSRFYQNYGIGQGDPFQVSVDWGGGGW
jgi:RHS repeat-associated protein